MFVVVRVVVEAALTLEISAAIVVATKKKHQAYGQSSKHAP
jgi:hypothetical protein